MFIFFMVKKKIVNRPWGFFQELCKNEKCSVKILVLNAKQSLSLQAHKKRDEFWKIILGSGEVSIGGEVFVAKADDEFYIKKNEKHRFKAKRKTKILEISFGLFDEDDEIRFEDKYGRKSPKSK
jgi:mannose-6-phosphate isomerase-like protein (cupin superfamily)